MPYYKRGALVREPGMACLGIRDAVPLRRLRLKKESCRRRQDYRTPSSPSPSSPRSDRKAQGYW